MADWKIDWKIVLVVLAGLLLIAFGLFAETGLNLGALGEKISDALGNPFLNEEEGNITISGTLNLKDLELKNIPLDEIKLSYDPKDQKTDFFIADTKLTTKNVTEIDLSAYKGTFHINESLINLAGDAEETTINGVKFETVKKLIPIKLGSLIFKNVYIKNFYMNRFEMENALGDIKIEDKIMVKLENEPLKLEQFSGSLNVTDGKFEIKGRVSGVSISGKDYTARIS